MYVLCKYHISVTILTSQANPCILRIRPSIYIINVTVLLNYYLPRLHWLLRIVTAILNNGAGMSIEFDRKGFSIGDWFVCFYWWMFDVHETCSFIILQHLSWSRSQITLYSWRSRQTLWISILNGSNVTSRFLHIHTPFHTFASISAIFLGRNIPNLIAFTNIAIHPCLIHILLNQSLFHSCLL